MLQSSAPDSALSQNTALAGLTDEELVALLRDSPTADLRAFDLLVERHEARILANCRHLAGSAADAPDLAQEVFVKAYFGLPRFESRARFSTWLQRIKVNHCLNFLKKQKGRTFLDVDEPATAVHEPLHVDPVAERHLEESDARALVGAVLERMSDTLRIPLVMRDMDELSYQEIAEELGIGLSAVKMRIKRGREEFRRILTEMEAGAAA